MIFLRTITYWLSHLLLGNKYHIGQTVKGRYSPDARIVLSSYKGVYWAWTTECGWFPQESWIGMDMKSGKEVRVAVGYYWVLC